MKFLFVIYTDKKYKKHLDNFKSQVFYRQICNSPFIEVIEWGTNDDSAYSDLPNKTQQMMKWCSENKEYDYLIKCDDTIFDDKWIHYSDRLIYENIFKDDDIEYSWKWGDYFDDKIKENQKVYYEPNTHWKTGLLGAWIKTDKISDDYRGINSLKLSEQDWKNYAKDHNFDNFDVSKLKDIPFFEGKFYMVSKEFSIFISEQEKFDMPVEDYMIGYYYEKFKSIRSISR